MNLDTRGIISRMSSTTKPMAVPRSKPAAATPTPTRHVSAHGIHAYAKANTTATTSATTTATATPAPSSSRLFVQNLPAYVDTKRLREHFASQGEVTDAVVVRTKDGAKSRRFGFVGFKTEAQAVAARVFFHQSFVDTTRINVTFAVAKEEESGAHSQRPWSKRTESAVTDASGNKTTNKKDEQESTDATNKTTTTAKKTKQSVVAEEGSAEFKEFMETMQARSKSKFWANDDVQDPTAAGAKAASDEAAKLFADDSDDEGDEIHEVRASDDEADDVDESDDDEKLRKGEKKAAPLSDLDFLRSKVNKKLDIDSDDDASMTSDADDDEEDVKTTKKNKKTTKKTTKGAQHDAVSADATEPETTEADKPTARLFVRNLPFTAVEEDLTDLFSAFGAIVEVHMPLDESKRRKGFGFVLFQNTVDAQRALEKLNGFAFQGRRLHVIYARVKPVKIDPEAALADPTLTYKQKKELERQLNANKQTGWNASFIRGDATVGTLADRMGVQRGDILDKEQGNMAVRLAIGETMLVKENKEFFAQQGVDLDAIEGALVKPGASAATKQKIDRSTSVILIKNLPHTTEEDELAQLFRKHGDLGRFLLAPSKTLALVEFFEPSEARRAFRSLAYKKYQHVPLYLEWAPVKVFNAALSKQAAADATRVGVKTTGAAALGLADVEDVDGGDNDDNSAAAAEANNTICVKNLSFNTKEQGLETLFRGVGKVRKVTVARRKDPKRGMLSMGFGFVEFADAKDAEKAIATLQAHVLDGHALNLRLSQKKINSGGDQTGKRSRDDAGGEATGRKTKIMVRNVAFEATSNEIRELFGAFGQLKRVRMPKKFDGKHRGFAFVEFLTEQEALTAFRALASSHLYGRHLVLEWATDADDMDSLRAKASRDLNAITETDRRKRVKHNQNELVEQERGVTKDDGDY